MALPFFLERLLGGRSSTGRRPRILVDVSVLYREDAGTGIQRVVREMLRHLPDALKSQADVVPIFATRRRGYRYCDVDRFATLSPLGQKGRVEGRVVVSPGDKFLGLDLCAHLLPQHARQLAAWRRHGVDLHVILYDLLPTTMQEAFTERAVAVFAAWLDWIDLHADSVICISRSVCEEARMYFAVRGNRRLRFSTFRLGADLPQADTAIYGEERLTDVPGQGFVLMVGTIEPRKGYDRVLDAFEWIWRNEGRDVAIVIVGRPGWKSERLIHRLATHQERGSRLFWLNDLDDVQLDHLYHRARMVLAASAGEGFGLPLIEAMRRGRPVLARDLPVFREIGGTSVRYFADDGAAPLASAIIDFVDTGPDTLDVSVTDWATSARDLAAVLGFANQGAGMDDA